MKDKIALPDHIMDKLERIATKRINVRELNAVVFRLDDVKHLISEILDEKSND